MVKTIVRVRVINVINHRAGQNFPSLEHHPLFLKLFNTTIMADNSKERRMQLALNTYKKR